MVQMLRTYEQLQFNFNEHYNDLYDILVPKDNKYRIIKENVKFNFIYDALEDKYCLDNGRDAVSPVLLFKYLIIKDLEHLSDEDVVKHSLYDLSMKYFLDMNVDETKLIHPSLLTKFRKLRLKDNNLLQTLLNQTTALGIKKGKINPSNLVMDATHSKAKYNSISPREMLIQRSKELRKIVYSFDGADMKEKFPKKKESTGLLEDEMEYCEELIKVINEDERFINNEKVQEKVHYLQEGLDDIKNKIVESSYDDEARTGHKTADTNFFGYKTHIATTEDGIAVAAVVTSGEKTDGQYLEQLVEMANEAGMEVKEVIADKAYSSRENIDNMNAKGIKVVSRLSSSVVNGNRTDNKGFEFNKDAQMYQCPVGELAVRKAKTGKEHQECITYYFNIEKCHNCPRKEECGIKEGQKTKTFSERIKEPTHLKQMEFEASEEFQMEIKKRYVIEQCNAILKNNHSYAIANSKGIAGMEIQGAIALFCMNLKKILYPYESKKKNEVNEDEK